MKLVQLTQGKFAMVDDEDYDRVMSFKWQYRKYAKAEYARRFVRDDEGKRHEVKLQNFILRSMSVYPINMDYLDCQKDNLQESKGGTRSEAFKNLLSKSNQGIKNNRKSKTSKYVGVHLVKKNSKWCSMIMINKKNINLGLFMSEYLAAKAYNEKALELFGENARLNII